MLPLYFLSGVFIPETELPSGVIHFADVFPIRHFFEAFFDAWTRPRAAPGSPGATSPSSPSGALAGLAARDPLLPLDPAAR